MGNIYQRALDAKKLTNINILVPHWLACLRAILAEARQAEHDAAWVRTHPVNVIFADIAYDMSNSFGATPYAVALQVCRDKASDPEQPRPIPLPTDNGDYHYVAEGLADAKPIQASGGADELRRLQESWAKGCEYVARSIGAHDPRFDRAAFLTTCGVNDTPNAISSELSTG